MKVYPLVSTLIMKAKGIFTLIAKGLVVGASMLVPGVSGGTTAIILGIYDKLIRAISGFFRDIRGNLLYLAIFCLGAGAGMLLFARAILFAVESWHFPMMFFFIGAIVGGIPMLYRQAKVKRFSPLFILYAAIGVAIVLSLGYLPKPQTDFSGGGIGNVIMMLVSGIIIAVALVLPGISTSHMLLVLGMYNATLTAIETLNFGYLVPIAAGVGAGIILTTKLLETALEKFPDISYFVIIGFVLGSLVSKEVFPGVPQGIEILVCLLTFAAGYAALRFVSRFSKE
jgi:putative membrane protein